MTPPTPSSCNGWQPIETAPKDGTEILLAALEAAEALDPSGTALPHGGQKNG